MKEAVMSHLPQRDKLIGSDDFITSQGREIDGKQEKNRRIKYRARDIITLD